MSDLRLLSDGGNDDGVHNKHQPTASLCVLIVPCVLETCMIGGDGRHPFASIKRPQHPQKAARKSYLDP